MRDYSVQFLDMLRMREVRVSLEPMSNPKDLKISLAPYPTESRLSEHAFYQRELNLIANLFLAAEMTDFDCAVHSTTSVGGSHTLNFKCDTFSNNHSVYDRLLTLLAMYQFVTFCAIRNMFYKAEVSSHTLYPKISVGDNAHDLELRYTIIDDEVKSKPVLDLVVFSNQPINDAIAPLLENSPIHCTFLPGNAFHIYRFYLNDDHPCREHSELYLNSPIGMYHCPICGDMQLAGNFHLPKE